jgi:magnesium-transporting ATPase (P-type)
MHTSVKQTDKKALSAIMAKNYQTMQDIGASPLKEFYDRVVFISGRSASIMVKNKYLIQHINFIMQFCSSIFGFEMLAHEKKILVEMIQKNHSDGRKVVLAVGDGFNDVAMLR